MALGKYMFEVCRVKIWKYKNISSGPSFTLFWPITLFHLSSHLLSLFNTSSDPDTKNSGFHLPPASLRQGLMEKGVKGVRVSPRQCGKILSAGCLQLRLCQPLHPPNEPAKATLHQSNTMFFWTLQLPGAQVKVRDRHADYTACLQIIIWPCRSPPTPSSFILHSSSNMSTSLSKGPFDPHYIFLGK